MRSLLSELRDGVRCKAVKEHLRPESDEFVRLELNRGICGLPSIFYAVQHGDIRILQEWVGYGVSVNTVSPDSNMPLLGFSIIRSTDKEHDKTEMVTTLLRLGASPSFVPKALIFPLHAKLNISDSLKKASHKCGDDDDKWWEGNMGKQFLSGLNLTPRYLLAKAKGIPELPPRFWQVAKRHESEAIFGIHYLVAQEYAVSELIRHLLGYFLLQSERPLVLVFGRPSGHGKTEIAK
ncbi:hypothetical protein P152DRAFT_167802 [Eremomyces bilateralis CBS 781.70]|uniref:Ankyrin n=1 Tax=Eremomyces bilateralis CBS 781.70 TaxID=1392243 RepID=A0A6G1FTR4_9PEZI|nr:uncharacterized protein P152DRAFT_167802 [Eremomyces bilateralis CBS 781.70]KAF1809275.1 hypothetical protein P152DRAFT_167802 [Eremomyces bilateralis CBS 781.70]